MESCCRMGWNLPAHNSREAIQPKCNATQKYDTTRSLILLPHPPLISTTQDRKTECRQSCYTHTSAQPRTPPSQQKPDQKRLTFYPTLIRQRPFRNVVEYDVLPHPPPLPTHLPLRTETRPPERRKSQAVGEGRKGKKGGGGGFDVRSVDGDD